MSDLPNDCYAVIETSSDYDTFRIITCIRNSEHNTFRSEFELQSRFLISADFDHPYGGSLEATAYSFTLTMLVNAAKVLKKIYNRTETYSRKFGYTDSATETIIRQLQAADVKEVRISMPVDHPHTFVGWNNVEALSLKKEIGVIRNKLNTLEKNGREKFPFTKKD